MKIELDDNVFWLGFWLIIGFVAIVAINSILKYNSLPYEKGYTEKQLENSQNDYLGKGIKYEFY